MDMEIVKTICPRCFKIFNVDEENDEVRCNFCKYVYDLAKFSQIYKTEIIKGNINYIYNL